MTTGERIRAARKAAGLTQLQVTERLGAGSVTVTQWERNKREPKISTLKRIAEAIGCPLSDLTGETSAGAMNYSHYRHELKELLEDVKLLHDRLYSIIAEMEADAQENTEKEVQG